MKCKKERTAMEIKIITDSCQYRDHIKQNILDRSVLPKAELTCLTGSIVTSSLSYGQKKRRDE